MQFLNNIKVLGLFLILCRRVGSETFEALFPLRSIRAGFGRTIVRVTLDGLTEKGQFVALTIFENKLNSFQNI